MKSLPAVLLFFLLITSFTSSGADWDEYVSHPAYIPQLHEFETPQMEPGQSGEFSFEMVNRYWEYEGQDMENVTVKAEIYMRADSESSENIWQMSEKNKPHINDKCMIFEGKEECVNLNSTQEISFEIERIGPNETVHLSFLINTEKDVSEGTYFVRLSIEFEHNGTARDMLSRGFWTQEEWKHATTDAGEYPGNINLTSLGVSGIVPDSSFSVRKPMPPWPLYIMIIMTAVFSSLSILFYLEERGNHPKLNKWLQQKRGKLNHLWLHFKNRKGNS